MELPDLSPANAEIWLAVASMALLILGVFLGDRGSRVVTWASVSALVVAGWIVWQGADVQMTVAGMFVADRFGAFAKVLILAGSALSLVLSLGYLAREKLARFEFPVLVLLGTLGMMVMVTANDLISLYVGLELQSLALYVLAAFNRDSVRSTESGLKYFVLGALASGILLYGATLLYGFTGTTSFEGIAQVLDAQEERSLGVLFGLVFLVCGLAFKVAAVPFHMWTPDVYEGAPTPVTAFFSLAPKVAALALFIRVMTGPFGGIGADWSGMLALLSGLSMLLGAFAAIGQRNIKRLMAYSSIGHAGYALMGLTANSPDGVRGMLLYMAIYVVMNVGAWGVIVSMRRPGGELVENIDDLAGMSRTRPMLAFAMAVFLFSLAGIPPLAGFFAKFYVFYAAVDAGLYTLAIVGVLSTVVGSYYYLRIVKIMYFDEPAPAFEVPDASVGAVVAAATVFILFFFLIPAPFVAGAGAAALALFP